MAKSVGKLSDGDHIFSLVSGNFIAGDFIEAWLIENDLHAEEIIIATLSVSKENIDSLKLLQDLGRVDRLGLIVSDYFFSHERRDGIEYIIQTLDCMEFSLAAAGIHTKLTLIKTSCGQHIVIGGSANLRSSRNVEQLTIDDSKDIYYFCRQWMAKLLNNYQATHKSLRGNKLWQQVAEEAEVEEAKVAERNGRTVENPQLNSVQEVSHTKQKQTNS